MYISAGKIITLYVWPSVREEAVRLISSCEAIRQTHVQKNRNRKYDTLLKLHPRKYRKPSFGTLPFPPSVSEEAVLLLRSCEDKSANRCTEVRNRPKMYRTYSCTNENAMNLLSRKSTPIGYLACTKLATKIKTFRQLFPLSKARSLKNDEMKEYYSTCTKNHEGTTRVNWQALRREENSRNIENYIACNYLEVFIVTSFFLDVCH